VSFFDVAVDQLRSYLPTIAEPADFDAFWRETLSLSAPPEAPRLTRVRTSFQNIRVFDVSFPGFAGDPIAGWLLVPTGGSSPLPIVVEFKGYGEGRGLPHERLQWAASGYGHFIMDTRGQGSMWGSGGVTGDPHGTGPAVPGMMTRGIEDPRVYYYRRLIADTVRAVESVQLIDQVDSARVIIAGSSQGGGLAIASAALAPNVFAVMADVPFLSHFRRAVGLATEGPYTELNRYLAVHREDVDSVFSVLEYFDAANFAPRVNCPSLFSVALQDTTCPPSTVYATYNRIAGPKHIYEYPYNDHEGGGASHWLHQIDWLRDL
jgi:cephalosporin-C deacetylase